MPSASITAPSNTQTGSFNVMVTFATAVTGFAKTDVALTARTENGVTGVDFSISGSGTTYNLSFTLPSAKEGSFAIRITGDVTPTNTNTPESVTANVLIVQYDTTADVAARFDGIVYEADGVIRVSIVFAENVIIPARSICEITWVSGDALAGITSSLIGKNKAYTLLLAVPPDRKGSFAIDITGDVFKVATHVWDNVIITPKTVHYDTTVPHLVNYDIPATYTFGEFFDVRLAFNVPVTGLHANSVQDVFILEGATLSTPTPYKWTGTAAPNFADAVPDALTTTDWTQLRTPPGGYPGDWHGEEGQFFLIRFPRVGETTQGNFNMTLREGILRGPTGNTITPQTWGYASDPWYYGEGRTYWTF